MTTANSPSASAAAETDTQDGQLKTGMENSYRPVSNFPLRSENRTACHSEGGRSLSWRLAQYGAMGRRGGGVRGDGMPEDAAS